MDGKEILKSSYYEYCLAEWSARKEIDKSNIDLTLQERCKLTQQVVLDGGDFDQRYFYIAFQEFENQNIEMSLVSSNPIVRMFALLDKRVGKRTLISLIDTMKSDLVWLRMFYHLRCDAENVDLEASFENTTIRSL